MSADPKAEHEGYEPTATAPQASPPAAASPPPAAAAPRKAPPPAPPPAAGPKPGTGAALRPPVPPAGPPVAAGGPPIRPPSVPLAPPPPIAPAGPKLAPPTVPRRAATIAAAVAPPPPLAAAIPPPVAPAAPAPIAAPPAELAPVEARAEYETVIVSRAVEAPRAEPIAAPVPAQPEHAPPEPEPIVAAAPQADLIVPALAEPSPPARPQRSTMEFLFELDSPTGPASRELDLRTMPEVAAAIAAADAKLITAPGLPVDEPPTDPAPFAEVTVNIDVPADDQVEAPPPAISATLPVITLATPPTAKTAEEQHDQRRKRVVTRLVTCRDTFRVLGFLDIQEADRKDVARLLMELDAAVAIAPGAPSVAKEPAVALAKADREQLDKVERLLAPIEDRLLALDELVQQAVLESRVENSKITAKALARYGRLLASRRFQAGPRRDRFEWIATQLLTRKRSNGMRELVGVDRATQALELLVGGLPHKPNEQELQEALAYLTDALSRLGAFIDHDAFFESGYFLDVHGYKVSMRDQLLNPNFLFLSSAINSALANRIEYWIRSLERLHKSNQLRQEGSPREQVTRRLREQEEQVAKIFGAKARPAAPMQARAEPKKKEPESKKAKAKAKRRRKFALPSIEVDKTLIRLLVSLALIVGLGFYLAVETGEIRLSSVERVDAAALEKISPLVLRGRLQDGEHGRELTGLIRAQEWRKLTGTQRKQLADRIAFNLGPTGAKAATISADGKSVIEIRQGLVSRVDTSGAR